MRILNAEPEGYSEEARAVLRGLGRLDEGPLDRGQLLEVVGFYDVLIVRFAHEVDRDVIDAGVKLRAIVTATTGLDHIDVEYAHSRGVEVLSLQGEREFLDSISATAEHTWALLLALVRRVPAASRSVRAGGWDRDRFRGRTLCGLRLGLLGLGRIGCMVARYGLAFGMRVAAHDPQAGAWPEGVERREALPDLLSSSDVLALHLPLKPETRGILGGRELALLPEGAVLVNTSRGELVDEAALVAALESGRLAGAAVDVIVGERDPEARARSPLLAWARTHDNVIVTPHLGGATREAMEATEVFMAKKLARVLGAMSD